MSDQELSTPGASPEPESAGHEVNPEAIEANPEATEAAAAPEASAPEAIVEEEPEEQDTLVVFDDLDGQSLSGCHRRDDRRVRRR